MAKGRSPDPRRRAGPKRPVETHHGRELTRQRPSEQAVELAHQANEDSAVRRLVPVTTCVDPDLAVILPSEDGARYEVFEFHDRVYRGFIAATTLGPLIFARWRDAPPNGFVRTNRGASWIDISPPRPAGFLRSLPPEDRWAFEFRDRANLIAPPVKIKTARRIEIVRRALMEALFDDPRVVELLREWIHQLPLKAPPEVLALEKVIPLAQDTLGFVREQVNDQCRARAG